MEGPGRDLPDSCFNNDLDAPVDVNPLPDASGKHLHFNNMESQPSGPFDADVQPPDIVLAQPNQLPDAMRQAPDTQLAQACRVVDAKLDFPANQVSDTITDTEGAIQVPDAKKDTQGAIQIPDAKADTRVAYEVPDAKMDSTGAIQVPDTKTDTGGAIQVPDAKLDTEAIQLTDSKTNVKPHQVPDAVTDTKASLFSDTKTDIKNIQVIDTKTDAKDIQVNDTKTDTKPLQVRDSTTDTESGLVLGTKPETKTNQVSDTKLDSEANQVPDSKRNVEADTVITLSSNFKMTADPKAEPSLQANETKSELATPKPFAASSDIASENVNDAELRHEVKKTELPTPTMNVCSNTSHSFLFDEDYEGSESGTEEEQLAFMKELEIFFRNNSMEFKPPKFYGEGLNCLKLWRAVTRLGGYDKVTSCKLWRQVGEPFKPPKTCTTVSWTFRGFYEKALLDYERHKTSGGELSLPVASHPEPMNIHNQASGSGRARRDAAARAMQGWHSQRVLSNGEVSEPIIKDKNSLSLQKREKQLNSLGLLKRKKPLYMEHALKSQRVKSSNSQLDVAVVDIGQPADWVKVNVQRTKDCFEVYALVPGLLREEVRVQSDPAGRLVISGEPENPDNPWGVTPFKKTVSLPGRIDPHQTSAVVTLHGQLFVRVPFEPSE